MKINASQAVREDWDQCRSWNYKLKQLSGYQSVVYAELDGQHGESQAEDLERVYFIIEGQGEFSIAGQIEQVSKGDVITIPPHTTYDYKPAENTTLKILLFMELWDN
jgi:mannose-6-phosphate isomerase-like protein (cupin superfamily)